MEREEISSNACTIMQPRAGIVQLDCGIAALAWNPSGQPGCERCRPGVSPRCYPRRNPGIARGWHAGAAVHLRGTKQPASLEHTGRRVCTGQLVALEAAGIAGRASNGLG